MPLSNGVEKMEHCLLYCHSHDAYRRDRPDSINSKLQSHGLPNALLLKLIMCGDKRLSDDSNIEILKATK